MSLENDVALDEAEPKMAAPDVQETLGVTPEGNCLRHPNCPVLSLAHNKIMPCRVCFSEEKSVGIRQRKSFAAVVQQLQQKADDDASVASGGDEVEVGERRRELRKAHAASMQKLILQQPQTLDSIMKRTTQVQNWLLRQKEKEVMSLHLRIQALEQSLHDAEAQNQEQRQTIWALRRTIQQDMKIIKTMAVQKERRENSSQHESPMNSSTTSSPSKRSGPLSDSPSLTSPGKRGNRSTSANSVSAQSTPMTSPAGKVSFSSSGPNTPDPDVYGVGNDSATPEAMKGIVMGNSDPLLDKVRQKKKALQSKFEELRAANTNTSANGSKDFQSKSVSSHDTGHDRADLNTGIIKHTDGNSLRTHSVRSLEDMVAPPQSSRAQQFSYNQKDAVFNPQDGRKQYWNDDEYAEMTSDSSKIFASFRGGLLDIPKSPPAASHDNRLKNRPKLQLDNDQMAQLKMPRMRGVGRTLSYQSNPDDNVSVDAMSVGSGSAGPKENSLFNIAASLGTVPLTRPWGDETEDQTFENQSTESSRLPGDDYEDRSVASAISSDSQPPPPPLHGSSPPSATIPQTTRKAKKPVITDEILDVVPEGHNEDEELGASKANFDFALPLPVSGNGESSAVKPKEDDEAKSNEQRQEEETQEGIERASGEAPKHREQKPPESAPKKAPPLPFGRTGPAVQTAGKRRSSVTSALGDDETIDTTPTFFSESGAFMALSGEYKKQQEQEQFLFPVTGAESQDKYGDPGMYTGTILVTEGMPHGKGCMNYESGRVYNGDWVSGQWHGHGKLLNPNGDTYEGEFVLDARHGKGEYRWDNGDVYTGDFSYDRRSGNGKFCFHNGNIYEGEFVDGMFEGFGRYEFKGGYYEGEWRQGRYHGDGELMYANGGKYTGEFRESLAHGFGVEMLPDGQKRRGVWERGQPVEFFNTRASEAQSVSSSNC